MSNDRGQGPHDRFMRRLMGDGPREQWSSLSDPTRECWAAADGAPNQLTSAELGKLVGALERCQATCPEPECGVICDWDSLRDTWLSRVREAWLALVRWEADHG